MVHKSDVYYSTSPPRFGFLDLLQGYDSNITGRSSKHLQYFSIRMVYMKMAEKAETWRRILIKNVFVIHEFL
jgi:hypothetical protein